MDRCPAMTSTPMFRVIVQCDYSVHPGTHHSSHFDTPHGTVGVNWEERPREDG